jgi:hypothetical protein
MYRPKASMQYIHVLYIILPASSSSRLSWWFIVGIDGLLHYSSSSLTLFITLCRVTIVGNCCTLPIHVRSASPPILALRCRCPWYHIGIGGTAAVSCPCRRSSSLTLPPPREVTLTKALILYWNWRKYPYCVLPNTHSPFILLIFTYESYKVLFTPTGS